MNDLQHAILRMQHARDAHTDSYGFDAGNSADPLDMSPAAENVPDAEPLAEAGPVGTYDAPGLDAYDGGEDVLAYDGPVVAFDYHDAPATFDAD